MDQSNIVGTISGALVGLYKSVMAMITLILTSGFISWGVLLDTAVLALIGGALGWCGSELMKLIKRLYKQRKLIMKKAMKIWKKFSFWNRIRMTIGAFGVGGELTLFLVDSYPEWKIIAAAATALSIALTYLFRDEDKNGIVDIFEKK